MKKKVVKKTVLKEKELTVNCNNKLNTYAV